jgi:hypothetical protein
MKTSKSVIRQMDNYNVIQRTKDGYFDANYLLHQWNSNSENTRKEINKFLSNEKTKEFIKEITIRESGYSEFSPMGDNQVVAITNRILTKSQKIEFGGFQVVIKGKKRPLKEGGSLPNKIWMHPLLFIDFAMWIDPHFKYHVLKFVQDKMIEYRCEAGDNYKLLSSAVAKLVPSFSMKDVMTNISKALNFIVFGSCEPGMRNKVGDEDKQKELFELEKKVAELIFEGFLNNYKDVMAYLKKCYNRKHCPSMII